MTFPIAWTPWVAIPLVILVGFLLPKLYRALVRAVAPDLGIEPPENPVALFATAAAILVALVVGSALLMAVVP